MTPDDIVLQLQINALPSHYQGSFLLQQNKYKQWPIARQNAENTQKKKTQAISTKSFLSGLRNLWAIGDKV